MELLRELTVLKFAALSADEIILSVELDKMRGNSGPAHALLFRVSADRAQELAFYEGFLADVAVINDDGSSITLIGEDGDVVPLSAEQTSNDTASFHAARGPIRATRNIGGQLYASGAALQVFRRDTPGLWKEIGPLLDEYPEQKLNILQDIDGFSADELYAAGGDGIIWWREKGKWRKVECATNLGFYGIHCAENGQVYACGQSGLLAVGRENRFELLREADDFGDFWDISFHDGNIYAATMRALMVYDGKTFEPCLPAMDIGQTFGQLASIDGTLWSIGEKDILVCRDDVWQEIGEPEWIA